MKLIYIPEDRFEHLVVINAKIKKALNTRTVRDLGFTVNHLNLVGDLYNLPDSLSDNFKSELCTHIDVESRGLIFSKEISKPSRRKSRRENLILETNF